MPETIAALAPVLQSKAPIRADVAAFVRRIAGAGYPGCR